MSLTASFFISSTVRDGIASVVSKNVFVDASTNEFGMLTVVAIAKQAMGLLRSIDFSIYEPSMGPRMKIDLVLCIILQRSGTANDDGSAVANVAHQLQRSQRSQRSQIRSISAAAGFGAGLFGKFFMSTRGPFKAPGWCDIGENSSS